MLFRSFIAVAALLFGGLAIPAAAGAQTQVVASTPAQGSIVKRPKVVSLTFSEAVTPSTAVVSIVMTAMPGVANHGEMVIRNFTTAWSNNNSTLMLTLRKPLHSGTYEVRWQAAGADGTRKTGKVGFTAS